MPCPCSSVMMFPLAMAYTMDEDDEAFTHAQVIRLLFGESVAASR